MTIDAALQIRPLSGTIGAELRGVNLGGLDDAAFRAVAQALWDNRRVMHSAVHDYDDDPRVMHRVTVQGERPER